MLVRMESVWQDTRTDSFHIRPESHSSACRRSNTVSRHFVREMPVHRGVFGRFASGLTRETSVNIPSFRSWLRKA